MSPTSTVEADSLPISVAFPQLQKILLSPAPPEVVQHTVEVLNSSYSLSWGNLKVFITEYTTIGKIFR